MATISSVPVFKMTPVQSLIGGHHSGNNNSNNTNTNITNNYGVQPLSVPETFRELIAHTNWVSPPEIDLDYLCDKYNQPEAGTGEWIFADDRYKEWREGSGSRLLWVCGSPGTGKTMLANRVVAEFLEGARDSPPGAKLGFHFVSPEFPTDSISADEAELPQRKLAKIASDILYGILQQDENLFDSCKAELRYQGDKLFTNPYSSWKVLGKVIRDCNTDPVYILIDGIDGLKESLCTEVIRKILGLMETHRVKIFLSSRDVPHVSNTLPGNLTGCDKINLDTNSLVREDVKNFIGKRVDGLGWDVGLKMEAKEALLMKSEGTFLWASLAVENLACFSSGPDFDTFLEKAPSKLEEIYRQILSSLSERQGSEKVLKMIQSVALALRPLTFGELGHVLACMEEKGKTEGFSPGGTSTKIQPRTEEEVKKYIQSSLGFLRATDTTVSLVHHTAREYIFSENSNGLPLLSKSEADLNISWECFRYLHQAFTDPETLQEGNYRARHHRSQASSSRQDRKEEGLGEAQLEVARNDLQKVVDKRPYLRYAAESWFIHAGRSIEILKDKFCDDPTHDWLQHQFFETSDIIRKPWVELCGNPKMEALAGEQTPLHIAVSLGLMPLVEKVLPDLTEETESNRSLLHLAAKFMSRACVTLIDRAGLSLLTAPDQDGNTPLHEAVVFGHWRMLVDLVKRFAQSEDRAHSTDIDKKNHSGNTALHLAFQFDRPEMVKFLVEMGADTEIKNNAKLTASELGVALGRGDTLDILKQALDIGDLHAAPQAPLQAPPPDSPQTHPQAPPQSSPLDYPRSSPLDNPQDPPHRPPAPPQGRLQDHLQVPPQGPPQSPPQSPLQDLPNPLQASLQSPLWNPLQAPQQDPLRDLQPPPQSAQQAPPPDSPQAPPQAPPPDSPQAPPQAPPPDPPQDLLHPPQAPPQRPVQDDLQAPPPVPPQVPPQDPPQYPSQDPPHAPLQAPPPDPPQNLLHPPQAPPQCPVQDHLQAPPQGSPLSPPQDLPQDLPNPLQVSPQAPQQDPPQDLHPPPQSPQPGLPQTPPQSPPQDPRPDLPQHPPHPSQAPPQLLLQDPQQAPQQSLPQSPLQSLAPASPRTAQRARRARRAARRALSQTSLQDFPQAPPEEMEEEASSIGYGEMKATTNPTRGCNWLYVLMAICVLGAIFSVPIALSKKKHT